MKESLKMTGAPTIKELSCSPAFPKKNDYKRGPIAVIECIEEIPCNPCETSCPKDAIKVGNPITNLPTIDFSSCSGCGTCVAKCPGLAIYLLDINYNDHEALITFPFEYLPLPEKGKSVSLVNRLGKSICFGNVVRVIHSTQFDCTPLITVTFSKKYYKDVVSMERLG